MLDFFDLLLYSPELESQNSSVVEQLTRNEQVAGSSPTSGLNRTMASLAEYLDNCSVCPNYCRVNRNAGERGKCRTGAEIVISAANLHFGEEAVLVGSGGSGTIFFTACNLACVYCQNFDISQLDRGQEISAAKLLMIMLSLQDRGAENINLVSPTHQAPQIFEVVKKARGKGLTIPIVYNCGGYENPEFLKALDGLVDIYMADFKYGSDRNGEIYSKIENYSRCCRVSLIEMYRQVGDLVMNERNIARRGLLIRHLVLPGGIAGSREVIDFIANRISPKTYLNIMDQYHPAYRAGEYRQLRRRVFRYEVDEIIDYAQKQGLKRVIY